jgi:surface antigen
VTDTRHFVRLVFCSLGPVGAGAPPVWVTQGAAHLQAVQDMEGAWVRGREGACMWAVDVALAYRATRAVLEVATSGSDGCSRWQMIAGLPLLKWLG